MQIIKDKHLVDNHWNFIGDDELIADQGDISVTLQRWKTDREQLINRSGKSGIRLNPTDSVEELEGLLVGVALIELNFPYFGDGRPFSQARLLRSLIAYQGEIRAVGQYLPDQLFYLQRVGVNAFQMDEQYVPVALSCLHDFTVSYQVSSN